MIVNDIKQLNKFSGGLVNLSTDPYFYSSLLRTKIMISRQINENIRYIRKIALCFQTLL